MHLRFLSIGISGALLALVACIHPCESEDVQVLADSVKQFSGTQGAEGWSYGYWERKSAAKYDPSTDFQLLRHFGSDSINRLSSRQEFKTGKLWYLEDGRTYTSLWAEGGHANAFTRDGEEAASMQWAVRRWTSSTNSRATISGRIGKVMPWGRNWRGGCKALIVVNGKELFAGNMDDNGQDYSIDINLEKGAVVDLLIGPNPTVGVVQFTAKITARR